MTDHFHVLDRKRIPAHLVGDCRRRLNGHCGIPRMIRLGDFNSGAREVWESADGQKFTLAFRIGHYELQEIAFGAEIVEIDARSLSPEPDRIHVPILST
jgi:hypothetical protein